MSAGLPTIPQTLDLLVIEDDRGFSAVLQKTLGKRLPALSVAVAPTLEDGLARLRAGPTWCCSTSASPTARDWAPWAGCAKKAAIQWW